MSVTNCTISNVPLSTGEIVGCRKGKMYNKEKFIEYLLNRDDFSTEFDLSHLKGLKSVKTLILTRMDNASTQANYVQKNKSKGDLTQKTLFKCPLTNTEMNGSVPFVFIWSCGCVFAKKMLVISLKDLKCPVVIIIFKIWFFIIIGFDIRREIY